MNLVTIPDELRQLEREVIAKLPGTSVKYDEPHDSEGLWWADFSHRNHKAVVEWRASTGFGLHTKDGGYGERPQDTFAHVNECVDNVVSRLRGE